MSKWITLDQGLDLARVNRLIGGLKRKGSK